MTTGITIGSEGVVLPLEMLNIQGEGITVLTLAQGAYLIIRSDVLAAYPRQRLADLSRTARMLASSRSQETITFTSRKRRALQELSQQGHPVSDGLEYGLQKGHGLQNTATPKISLGQVRQGLSTMEGSLSQQVLAERRER